MIETIIIGGACLLAGTVCGYFFPRKPKKPFQQCECLRKSKIRINNKVIRDNTIRCELPLFHTGPHCYTVDKQYINHGEKIWWENTETSINALLGPKQLWK